MSNDLEKAMAEYEAACADLSLELRSLADRLGALAGYQGSLLTATSLLTSWLQNAEELWEHRRRPHSAPDC